MSLFTLFTFAAVRYSSIWVHSIRLLKSKMGISLHNNPFSDIKLAVYFECIFITVTVKLDHAYRNDYNKCSYICIYFLAMILVPNIIMNISFFYHGHIPS